MRIQKGTKLRQRNFSTTHTYQQRSTWQISLTVKISKFMWTLQYMVVVTKGPSGSRKNLMENPSSAIPRGRFNGLCGRALSSLSELSLEIKVRAEFGFEISRRIWLFFCICLSFLVLECFVYIANYFKK